MKAQTYHPYTVGRQARKGGGGSVPPGLAEQVAANTIAISVLGSENSAQARDLIDIRGSLNSLSSQVSNIPVLTKETLKVYGPTYTYNDPATEPDYPGLHSGTVNLLNKTPVKVIFEGWFKEVEGVEQQAWDAINFKAPGGSMVGYCDGFKREVLISETPGLRDGATDKIPYLVLGKETYNNDYTKFMLCAEPMDFRGRTLGVSVVLDSSATGTGSTEADIEALYTWDTGVYAKFTVICY